MRIVKTLPAITFIIIFSLSLLKVTYTYSNEKDIYIIGVENINYPPYYTINKGEWKGEVVKKIFEQFAIENNIQFIYRAMPINDLYQSLLDNDIDFKFPDNETWKNDIKINHSIHYSSPIIDSADGTVVRKDKSGRKPYHIKKVSLVKGFTPWPWMDYSNKTGHLLPTFIETDSLNEAIKLATEGKVDGIFGNVGVIKNRLKKDASQPNDYLIFDRGLPFNEINYKVSTKNHPDIINMLDVFLQENRHYISSIKRNWYKHHSNSGQ